MLAASLTVGVIVGCERPAPARAASSRPAVAAAAIVRASARRFSASGGDTLWTVPLVSGDTSGTPAILAADGENVYVADFTTNAVVALRAATGATRWTSRSSTDPRVRSIAPSALAARRRGGVIAVDQTNASLVFLSPDGRVERELRLGLDEPTATICELPDGGLLAGPANRNRGLTEFSATGAVRGSRPLPWPDLLQLSALLSQVVVAPTRDGCVAALFYGRGFARFANGRFETPVPYVEDVPLAKAVREVRPTKDGYVISNFVEDHSGAALSIAVTGDEILTAFGGHTDDRNHLIDRYNPDGRYVGSVRTSRVVSTIAADEHALYIATRRAGRPIIVALRSNRATSQPVAP